MDPSLEQHKEENHTREKILFALTRCIVGSPKLSHIGRSGVVRYCNSSISPVRTVRNGYHLPYFASFRVTTWYKSCTKNHAYRIAQKINNRIEHGQLKKTIAEQSRGKRKYLLLRINIASLDLEIGLVVVARPSPSSPCDSRGHSEIQLDRTTTTWETTTLR
jgi:hypothetical protein